MAANSGSQNQQPSFQYGNVISGIPPRPPRNTNTSTSTIVQYSQLSRPTFIARVEEIRPNYTVQGPRAQNNGQGLFLPPDRRDAYYEPAQKYLFRYQDGTFQEIPYDNPTGNQYSSASVFSQMRKTDQLLAVPFDARTINVADQDHDWMGFHFEHKAPNAMNTYASLDLGGEKEELPARAPATWTQLIPSPYRCPEVDSSGRPVQPSTEFAGLIGSLPLLVALAAFSAIPDALSATLSYSLQAGRWWPHNYSTGRLPERGLVVTIYLDPLNPGGSSTDTLNSLQDGAYGPFIGP